MVWLIGQCLGGGTVCNLSLEPGHGGLLLVISHSSGETGLSGGRMSSQPGASTLMNGIKGQAPYLGWTDCLSLAFQIHVSIGIEWTLRSRWVKPLAHSHTADLVLFESLNIKNGMTGRQKPSLLVQRDEDASGPTNNVLR